MALIASSETMDQPRGATEYRRVQPIRTPDGPCYFWSLPTEISTMVFDLCYGDQRVIQLQSRRLFRALEEYKERQQKRHYVPTAFPASFIAHLVISRQYFQEAIRVWARPKIFSIQSTSQLEAVLDTGSAFERHLLREISSVTYQTTAASSCWTPTYHRTATMMSGLKCVTMPELDEYWFHHNTQKSVWSDELTDLELIQNPDISSLLVFRGLHSLTVQWSEPSKILEPREEMQWARFQTQVQKLINDVVQQPREQNKATRSTYTFEHAFQEVEDSKREREARELNLMTTRPVSAPFVAAVLDDNEIPRTETDLLRLFLARPQAMVAWLQGAKLAKARLRELHQGVITLD